MVKENLEEFRGVSWNVFANGIRELSLDNRKLVKRIFKKANVTCTGYLNWDEFLEAMKIVFTDDLELKIELFFDIIDR